MHDRRVLSEQARRFLACHALYRLASVGSPTVNRHVHFLQKTLMGRVKELEAQLADVAKQRDKDLNELQARLSLNAHYGASVPHLRPAYCRA